MNTTLTVKTSKKLRDDAKKTADELGVPLTTIVNAMLKQFVREKMIHLAVHPVPKASKIREWDKISDEADAGRGITGSFQTFEELQRHMRSVWSAADKAKR